MNDGAWVWMEVDVKNRSEVGQKIEYISPQNKYRFQISSMENESRLALQVAHGGNGTVWLKTEGTIDRFALLSRVVNEPAPSLAS